MMRHLLQGLWRIRTGASWDVITSLLVILYPALLSKHDCKANNRVTIYRTNGSIMRSVKQRLHCQSPIILV